MENNDLHSTIFKLLQCTVDIAGQEMNEFTFYYI